jgi:hypothetical protein
MSEPTKELTIIHAHIGFILDLAIPMEIEKGTAITEVASKEDIVKLSAELEETMKKQYGALCQKAKVTSFKVRGGKR